MRLIVVTPHFWSEFGVGVAVSELTQELIELGVDLIAVIHSDPRARSYVKNAHEPIRTISSEIKDNLFLKPFGIYLFSRRAAESLKSPKNDYGDDYVIHSHSLFPTAFLGKAYKEMKATFVNAIHGTYASERESKRKSQCTLWTCVTDSLPICTLILRVLARRCKSHMIALSPENARRYMELVSPGHMYTSYQTVLTSTSLSLMIATKLERS